MNVPFIILKLLNNCFIGYTNSLQLSTKHLYSTIKLIRNFDTSRNNYSEPSSGLRTAMTGCMRVRIRQINPMTG